MDWLSQNWVWVAVAIGVAFYFLRGSLGAHAGGHGGGLLEGMGHGGHAGGGGHGEPPDSRAMANAPEAAVDAVSGAALRTAQALTSLYQGKIYYFASKENSDRFEAAPQDYAAKAAGHPVGAAEAPQDPPRRHGCC